MITTLTSYSCSFPLPWGHHHNRYTQGPNSHWFRCGSSM